MMKKSILIVFVFWMFISAGCSRSETANQNTNNNSIIADLDDDPEKISNESYEELGLYITVPYEPEETFWRRSDAGTTAVLRFTPEDTNKIVAESELEQNDIPANVKVEEWFPKELLALAELNDGEMVNGHLYSSRKFDKDNNLNGLLVKIDQTDLFVVIYKSSN